MRTLGVISCLALALLGTSCRARTPDGVNAATPSARTTAGTTPSPSFSPGQPAITSSPIPNGTPTGGGGNESAAPYRTIGSVDDGRGDAGTEARPYNDLVGVRIQNDGRRARVLVRLAATAPDRMPEGEQMGIGIDFFEQPDAEESTFQIFAAGTADGWQAFFETPNGFVKFPGTFRIEDDILEFVIPWSAFDDLRGSRFTTFLDWDREALAVGIAGQDRAPNGETRARFSR